MRWLSRNMVGLLILVLLAWSMQSATAEQKDADFSGTITMPGTSVAAGIGWSWGRGTLTLLDGSQHQFTASGLDVAAVGIKQAPGVGHVYHLKKLEDLDGSMSG